MDLLSGEYASAQVVEPNLCFKHVVVLIQHIELIKRALLLEIKRSHRPRVKILHVAYDMSMSVEKTFVHFPSSSGLLAPLRRRQSEPLVSFAWDASCKLDASCNGSIGELTSSGSSDEEEVSLGEIQSGVQQCTVDYVLHPFGAAYMTSIHDLQAQLNVQPPYYSCTTMNSFQLFR